MRILYVDTLFLLNLIVNYLLLLATAKIAAVHTSRVRLGLGALFGAVYAVAAVFPQFSFFLSAPMRVLSGAAVVLIAFGVRGAFFRLVVLFFAVSAAFGGAIFAISLMAGGPAYDGHHVLPISLKVLIVAFLVCYGALSLVFARLGRGSGARVAGVEITHRGRSARFTGLIDTGNSLVDPVTGGAVLVAETEALAGLFDSAAMELLLGPLGEQPVELFPKLHACPTAPRFYLLPYTAVGTRVGFLLAFRPDRVRIDGKETAGISVALSPTRVSDGGRYAALVNGGALC
ncbi:MAG: sigma-E processing peptidase SpoIIGA [Oscillospiraceae bacterium]|nr:sigma-E processing peptidase SpoIIGA [Oscillospiraceae bacterium]